METSTAELVPVAGAVVVSKDLVAAYLRTLPEQQRAQIAELRAVLSDTPRERSTGRFELQPAHDDLMLLRLLRARKFNVGKAAALFHTCMGHRNEWQFDTLLSDPTVGSQPAGIKWFPCGWHGEDLQGGPIYIEAIGSLDVKGITKAARREDLIRLKLKMGEMALKLLGDQSRKYGRVIPGITCIYDLRGLTMGHLYKPFIKIFTELAQIFEDSFPEILRKMFVVFPPAIFPAAFALVKPFLSEDTREKIVILGNKPHDVAEALLQHIAPDQLFKRYGGTAEDPHPDPLQTGSAGYPDVSAGGEVPKEMFLEHGLQTSEQTRRTVVDSGSVVAVAVDVQTRSSVSYEFQTEERDISFALKQFHSDTESITLDEGSRVCCDLIPHLGSRTLDPGQYRLEFDNRYSWMRAKKVCFRITVEEHSDSAKP